MKYPLPLAIPQNRKVIMSQPFGDTSMVEWYKSKGINLTAHNGIDLVLDADPGLNYGTKIVCPVPEARLDKIWWDNPMSTKGNGVQIVWREEGKKYQMRAWHCSEVTEQTNFVQEDVIAYMGNSGAVWPEPTPACPHCGSHVHLMLYTDGVLVDPLTIFDKDRWFTSPDTGIAKDLPPLFWVVDWLKNQIAKLARKRP